MPSPEKIQRLFEDTLAGEYYGDAAWDAVIALRVLGTAEVCEQAVQWCQSPDPLKRARAADILGQLGRTRAREHTFPEEAFQSITRMLETEHNARPLASAIFALGHLHDARAIPTICRYPSHDDAGVRYAVAVALGSYADDPAAIQVLLRLMEDPSSDTRDWATFALGTQGDADNDQIRDALAARLTDPDSSTQEEAVAGLAKRHDLRALPVLQELLAQSEVSPCIREAAALLGIEPDRVH